MFSFIKSRKESQTLEVGVIEGRINRNWWNSIAT